jgi:hypothetical protein
LLDNVEYEVARKIPLAKLWNKSGQWNGNIAGNNIAATASVDLRN